MRPVRCVWPMRARARARGAARGAPSHPASAARASAPALRMEPALDFYTWDTPNGKKVSICLEEMGLTYTTKPVNIGTNTEQFEPAFVAISPNSKIPGLSVVFHPARCFIERTGCRPSANLSRTLCSHSRPCAGGRRRPRAAFRVRGDTALLGRENGKVLAE
eukprot:SAG31_NODE_15819_length_737_cov_0.974922_1_plen_162_part_00